LPGLAVDLSSPWPVAPRDPEPCDFCLLLALLLVETRPFVIPSHHISPLSFFLLPSLGPDSFFRSSAPSRFVSSATRFYFPIGHQVFVNPLSVFSPRPPAASFIPADSFPIQCMCFLCDCSLTHRAAPQLFFLSGEFRPPSRTLFGFLLQDCSGFQPFSFRRCGIVTVSPHFFWCPPLFPEEKGARDLPNLFFSRRPPPDSCRC